MFKISLVIFREMLEISLILGIISAATRSMKNSSIYITMGIMGGVVSAAFLAFFITVLSNSLGGYGEEIVDVAIILVTVFIISGTAIWIKNSASKLNSRVEELSESAEYSIYARMMLVLVVLTTIFREGTEIILFVHAISSAYSMSSTEYAIGFAVGIISGIIASIVVSYGLHKLAIKSIFKVSFILLALIAASLASEAAGILTSIGFVDFLDEPIWDSNWIVSDFSFVGKVLKMFVGYNTKPNGLQIIFYVVTLLMIYILSKIGVRKKNVKVIS